MDLYLPAELRELREEFPDWRDAPAEGEAHPHSTEHDAPSCADAQWQVI